MGIVNHVGVVLAFILVSCAAFLFVLAADEDPLQDFCVADARSAVLVNGFPCKPAAAVKAEDFKSAVLKNPGDTNNLLRSNTTPANVQAFPGINTLGISLARVDYAPGGLNPPHVHPRATEMLFLQQGTLYVGFITTNKTLFAQTLNAGEHCVFPRALIHFQLNICKEPALALTALNSQNPGVIQVARAVFASKPPIDNEVIQKAFQLQPDLIPRLRELIGQR